MAKRKGRPVGTRPVARNTHAVLLKAAAERDPRVAARLVDMFAGKLDQATLLQLVELQTHALSVVLHALDDTTTTLATLLSDESDAAAAGTG